MEEYLMNTLAVIVLVVLIYGVSLAGFCAWLAEEKGRDGMRWFWLGFLFGFIALLAIAGAPVLEEEEEQPRRGGRRFRSR
jgi:hypothetical protein